MQPGQPLESPTSVVTFGGQPVHDPETVRKSCLAQQPPFPLEPWYGRANSFVSPVGADHGYGMLLMCWRDVEKLDLSKREGYPLVFDDTKRNAKLTFERVYVTRVAAVVPSYGPLDTPRERDPETFCRVEVVDERWFLRTNIMPTGRWYNLRAEPTRTYWTHTLNGGSPWTWKAMFRDVFDHEYNPLADRMDFATADEIFDNSQFQPDGTPEQMGWRDGTTYAVALKSMLARLNWFMWYDPAAKTKPWKFGFMGRREHLVGPFLKQFRRCQWWDSYVAEPTLTTIPQYVETMHRIRPFPSEGQPAWEEKFTLSETRLKGVNDGVAPHGIRDADTMPNSTEVMRDDLGARRRVYPACEDDDSAEARFVNNEGLSTRETYRAADWAKRVRDHRPMRFQQWFGTLSKDVWAKTGGENFTALSVEDRGRGLILSLSGDHLPKPTDWEPVEPVRERFAWGRVTANLEGSGVGSASASGDSGCSGISGLGSASGSGCTGTFCAGGFLWREVMPAPCGQWAETPSGLQATDCADVGYHPDGAQMAVGAVVLLRYEPTSLDWRVVTAGGGEYVDLVTSVCFITEPGSGSAAPAASGSGL